MTHVELKMLISCAFILLLGAEVHSSCFEKSTCNLGWEHVKHTHSEAAYQHAWCSRNNGIVEYENKDLTRVDCLTATHAVEFDFANKWAESIGQAMHYGIMTGKKPKVVLILEKPEKQILYYKRVKKIGEKYGIDTEYVTDKILNIDKNGQCFYPKCKCRK